MHSSPDSSNVSAPSPRRRVVTARDPDPEGTARAEAARKAPLGDRPRAVYVRGADGVWFVETEARLAVLWGEIIRRGLNLASPEARAYTARRDAFADARYEFKHACDMASS